MKAQRYFSRWPRKAPKTMLAINGNSRAPNSYGLDGLSAAATDTVYFFVLDEVTGEVFHWIGTSWNRHDTVDRCKYLCVCEYVCLWCLHDWIAGKGPRGLKWNANPQKNHSWLQGTWKQISPVPKTVSYSIPNSKLRKINPIAYRSSFSQLLRNNDFCQLWSSLVWSSIRRSS